MKAARQLDTKDASDGKIRVMIVDDHDVVRAGLRSLLESAGDVAVISEAADERTAIIEAVRTKPDVILMDVRLGAGSGISATRVIRSELRDVAILMLTAFSDDEALTASVVAGASGYVLKEVLGSDLVQDIRAVAGGGRLFNEKLARSAMDRLKRGKHLLEARLARLSPQEERILEQIARGQTNAEIAKTLNVAEKTVKNYVSNVLLKLDVSGRAEAAAYLARHTGSAG